MNHHHHHSRSSPNSAPPAFVAAFYASSYDDDDELEFSAEQVHSDNGVAFIAPAAPTSFSADMAARHQAIADEDDDDALFVPSTKYRDTQHVFANGPCDLVFNSESFSESSFFSRPGKTPVFVLENAPKKSQTEFASPFPFAAASSPLSPSSYSDKVDVPQKESCSYFCVNPSIPSRQSPTKIMDTLKAALLNFDCDFEVVRQWSIKVNLLCVAEEIAFTIELTRAPDASLSQDSYEIDFVRQFGDETKFVELAEYIRSLCSEIDDEALPFLSKSLEPWLDAKQEIAGRRHAIKEKEAASLIQELNAELHPDTLFEVTKMIKDHCRHKGNRKLFLQADHKNFLKGLKWMLTDCEEVARFGVFILLQFAKDQGVDGADECDLSSPSFFMSPYDKSSFALLLDEVLGRQQEAPCGRFTSAMVEQVQQSWVFA